MFKFKYNWGKRGSFYFNGNQFIINGDFTKDNKEVANFLRNSADFTEIKSTEKLTSNTPPVDPVEELEKARNYAIELGLKPHHKAGLDTILKSIEEKEKELNNVFDKINSGEVEVKVEETSTPPSNDSK